MYSERCRQSPSYRPLTAPVCLLALCLLFALSGCGAGAEPGNAELLDRSWQEILAEARGQKVTWAMWMGDPNINRYVEEYVRPELRKRYGVKLEMVSAQGKDILSMLMTEMEAGQEISELDLLWINGENFYQLRRIGALYGPFVEKLPNSRFVDLEDPFIQFDFQRSIDGWECPWGNVQFTLIYDEARVSDPPRTMEELAAWVHENPGRFTLENGFTGMTFLKSLLIHLAGGPGSLDGPFDEQRYAAASAELWSYLNDIRPHLWRGGETFPGHLSQLHQLFAAGEVDFTMSNNDAEADNKVLEGLFPETTRAYVLDSGTIQNSHYLGISRRSEHAAGALVAIDFLISPEAQLEKLKPSVWGDGTVLDLDRLPEPWPRRFLSVPQREHAPPRSTMQPRALAEPAPEYMIRIYEDFRTHVIER
jgi:putative spermidine/putrescine transport system substrate-binding protein